MSFLLSKQNGYFFDTRKPGERQQYGDAHVLTDGRLIRFEVADEKDTELVAEQFMDGFLKHSNIFRALDAKRKDLNQELIYDMTHDLLQSRGTLLGFYNDKLVCFRIVRYIPNDELVDNFGPLSNPGDAAPIAVFPKDYGTLVDAVPEGSFLGRVMTVMNSVPEKQLGKFLPLDVQKLAFSHAVNVHENFQKRGLGAHISALTEKLASENGCNYIVNITVATASSKIAAKKGFKVLYNMPYNKFYVHGILIFENLYDGAAEANINLGKLS